MWLRAKISRPKWKGLGADSVEKHEPASDIDTEVVDSLIGPGSASRFVIGRAATNVDRHPNIAKPQKRRLALAQHRSAEDVTIECY